MKISTEIVSASKIVGEEKAIEYLAKAGFDAWDFSMFSMCRYDWSNHCILDNDHPLSSNEYLKFARRLKQVSKDNGVVCNQSHAPFPSRCAEVRSFYKRAIECTAEVGGEICVIHPEVDSSPEKNAEMYLELLPFAKECNVKIATENMYNWDDVNGHSSFAACATPESFNAHLRAVNDDFFTACLDIGHAEMKGSNTNACDMILALGSNLSALHIHDNDKWHDSHQIPFSMNVDFEKIVSALRQINYKGYFTLEADAYLKKYSEDNIFDGIVNLKNSVRKLADMFENM